MTRDPEEDTLALEAWSRPVPYLAPGTGIFRVALYGFFGRMEGPHKVLWDNNGCFQGVGCRALRRSGRGVATPGPQNPGQEVPRVGLGEVSVASFLLTCPSPIMAAPGGRYPSLAPVWAQVWKSLVPVTQFILLTLGLLRRSCLSRLFSLSWPDSAAWRGLIDVQGCSPGVTRISPLPNGQSPVALLVYSLS